MNKRILTFLLFILLAEYLPAQTCTNTGQTPSSAILICGAESYAQGTVPNCGQTNIPVPCAATSIYQNTNPFWFRMNCFSPGTLGFVITPNEPTDNYDWQLFDISGRNDDDVFSDPSLFVACNWCTDPGETGASVDGNNLAVCTGTSLELFSKMPNIIQGHEYLLMVAHRNSSEAGFTVTITGGSGSVTDPVEPRIFNARLNCNSSAVTVLLNKKMFCNTMAPDGSDFTLSPAGNIISATISGCSNGEANVLTLTLSSPVPPGNYTLTVKKGSDGNTMEDRCGRYIFEGDHVPVIIPSPEPVTMDSLTKPGCSPSKLHLVFKKPIQCNSIALNGSDFVITGPQPVTISNVGFSCNTQTITTMEIDLTLLSPILTGGTYQLSLTTGNDGNTLVEECGSQLAATSLSFTIKSSVSASFTYTIGASCREDTIYFTHTGGGGVSNWNWSFDNVAAPSAPTQIKIYPATGTHTAQLIVSNGICSDTARENIVLDNKVIAAFEAPPVICPEDPAEFINKSTGTVDLWQWSFGNNITSNQHSPPPFHYSITGRDVFYTVKLVAANNSMNCKDSVTHRIQVLSNCYIAVPTAFTPNGDGLNDYLYPNNAVKADDLLFRVYNRLGELVFETRDWTRKWDGKIKGVLQQTGVFAWVLIYTYHDTGEKVFRKGTTVLIR